MNFKTPTPDKKTGTESPPAHNGLGMAMRLGTEMVTATLIGVGMGYGLDKWLGTQPWLTLLFFLFGSVAGFRNMYRLATINESSQKPT